jgi:hypothetical protein
MPVGKNNYHASSVSYEQQIDLAVQPYPVLRDGSLVQFKFLSRKVQ